MTIINKKYKIKKLNPIGLAIYNIDIKELSKKSEELDKNSLEKKKLNKFIKKLEKLMAKYGFIVFKNQGILDGNELVKASKLWGAKEMHSTHGVHPKAPNEHIFRLSNNRNEGILGIGPQWHNDGSFERNVFSHVGYHIIKTQKNCGTDFSHQGLAYNILSEKEKKDWENMTSVNSNSGILHPLIHKHPLSGMKSIWLHLGMTGAVIKYNPLKKTYRLLNKKELKKLMNRYNEVLNNGFNDIHPYSMSYEYEEGDMVFIDNWAISHRAMKKAHIEIKDKNKLRILDRTTIKSPYNLDPIDSKLPYILKKNRFNNGVWIKGSVGFNWDCNERLQN